MYIILDYGNKCSNDFFHTEKASGMGITAENNFTLPLSLNGEGTRRAAERRYGFRGRSVGGKSRACTCHATGLWRILLYR